MTALLFPGGIAIVDPEHIWRELQRWLEASASRRCNIFCDSLGYGCRLTRDSTGQDDPGFCLARSQLGLADAVANALQAAQGAA